MLEKKKNILITGIVATTAAFLMGCGLIVAPVIAGKIATTPAESEKIIPAEYTLGGKKAKGKIAIVIEQPSWIKTPMDLRITLTDAINLSLVEKLEIKQERLIPYSEVKKCRLSLPEEKRDNPFEIASKLGAAYLLTVQVADFTLNTFAEEDFFNGTMVTKSCLFDANNVKLWPQDANDECRTLTVGIEAEKGTVKTSVERLCAATAHCITRYFYDCKKAYFRIKEEQEEYENYTW